MSSPRPANPADQTSGAAVARTEARRRLLRRAAAGTAVIALGGIATLLDDLLVPGASASPRRDGRPRVPPGQRRIGRLKPMGGDPGPAGAGSFRLQVHGLVRRPLELTFGELMSLGESTAKVDVHCVTGWSMLDLEVTGVRLAEIARAAEPLAGARHVILEAAHGYTANLRLSQALSDNVRLVHTLASQRLAQQHGAPVRAIVPDLYFWKSAKWIQGIRFVARDEPGYWERRGYNNNADPWREQRYA